MLIRDYKDLMVLEIRDKKEVVGRNLNIREFFEIKEVVTVKNMMDYVGLGDPNDGSAKSYIAVPYLLGNYYEKNSETGELETDNRIRLYLRVYYYQGKVAYSVVKVDHDTYSGLGDYNIEEEIRVDEFVADYALAKFRKGWIDYQKFQKRMGILKIKGIMDKNKISMDDVKNYDFSDYCGN